MNIRLIGERTTERMTEMEILEVQVYNALSERAEALGCQYNNGRDVFGVNHDARLYEAWMATKAAKRAAWRPFMPG
jgi:hypothetical protein